MHDKVKLAVANALFEAISSTYSHQVADKIRVSGIYESLTPPPNLKLGHLAFGLFVLAKEVGKAPPLIANELIEKLPKCEFIEKAVSVGPYLNVFLNIDKVASFVLSMINSEQFFEFKLTENAPKSMVEFSQPNTHKEMHVGHMRNLCLGDSLINILRYCGIPTLSTTFPGDVGTHVAKCLWFYKKHNNETPPATRKGAWLGTLYTAGNNLLTEQIGSGHEEVNRAELTEILKQLEKKEGEYFELWKETRNWSIEQMREVYDWAGVEFDVWYWESDVDSDSVKLIREYQEKGLFKVDDGAVGIDLSEEKLGFCILLKSDGTGLYATKDIELARRKFQEHEIEKNIYVVDNRQSHHFKQVFKVLEKMGFEQAKDCYHLQYEMVELPDGAMSSRKGNIVPIQVLIDEMVAKIKNEYLDKYENDWSTDQINYVANQVARGAIKYGMTRIDSNKKIVFDMEEWLKLDGESGPYIQYVHARINSMLQKIDVPHGEIDYKELTHSCERDLILKLMDFNHCVQVACSQYKTSHLCSYLYDLAKLFNSFYAECSVANAPTQDLKFARYNLSLSVATTLRHGLKLLGIDAPERM